MNLARAIDIATEAHRGQVDKAGADYIQHPIRMMEAVGTEPEKSHSPRRGRGLPGLDVR